MVALGHSYGPTAKQHALAMTAVELDAYAPPSRNTSSGTRWPTWRSGAVGSRPSLTRSDSPRSRRDRRCSSTWISTARFRRRSNSAPLMPLGVDGAWAEVDLRVGRQHRLEDRDNRLPERPHERHRDMRAVDGVADALLRRVELCAPERIAGSLELVRDQDGEEQPGEHSDDHAGHPVEHDRLELDLAVRKLRRTIDDDDDREKDPEETVDARVGGPVARRLLQDSARLQAHVGGGDAGEVEGNQSDQAPHHPGEVTEGGIDEDQHDRDRVNPGHLAVLTL